MALRLALKIKRAIAAIWGGNLFEAVVLEMAPGPRIFIALPVFPLAERTDQE